MKDSDQEGEADVDLEGAISCANSEAAAAAAAAVADSLEVAHLEAASGDTPTGARPAPEGDETEPATADALRHERLIQQVQAEINN